MDTAGLHKLRLYKNDQDNTRARPRLSIAFYVSALDAIYDSTYIPIYVGTQAEIPNPFFSGGVGVGISTFDGGGDFFGKIDRGG